MKGGGIQSPWALGPRDFSCIWLISNEVQAHYNTTVGCDLEASAKGGSIQILDDVHGRRDSVTCCHQDLNLKVAR